MIEAMLIIAGGLLGSGHCLGMCGGFALTLGSQSVHPWHGFVRQFAYAVGRVSVYTLAGAFVGFGGWQLGRSDIVNVQAVLSVIAGLFLIAEGMFSAGWLPRPFASKKICPGANVFAALLKAPNLSAVFVAGLVNGLLPCGLVYAYLALAASASNLFDGAFVMALFGFGTMPALILTGVVGTLMTHVWRQRIFRLAALCMILTGVLALWRGAAVWQRPGSGEVACPYCAND
jgi:sulfite exporter TauE/SafE